MGTLSEPLSAFCDWLIRSTVRAGVLILLILAVQSLLRAKVSARWHCWFWVLLVVQMAMPWAPPSRVSLFNLIPYAARPERVQAALPEGDRPGFAATPAGAAADETTAAADVATGAGAAGADAAPAAPGGAPHPPGLALTAAEVAGWIWLAGAAGMTLWVLLGSGRLWRAVRSQRPLTDQKTLDLLEACKARMRVRTPLVIVPTDSISTAAIFGFLRPRLLLPRSLIETAGEQELRCIFLHELAHLKRHDIPLGWLTAILQILHWFNPLVWVAFSRMRADRELACDALALSSLPSEESREYGRSIVSLLERFSQRRRLPALAGILESKSQLKRRITMIARSEKGSYRWSAFAVAALVALGGLTLTSARAGSGASRADSEAPAKEFVQLLVREQFEKATEHFDAAMKKAMPAEKLASAWKGTTDQAAPFRRQLGLRTQKYLSYDIVLVTCEFAKGPLDVKMAFNSDGRITGLWFVPTPQEVLERYQGIAVKKPEPVKMGPARSMGALPKKLRDGLVFYYSFDKPTDESKALDMSGNGNHGKVHGAKYPKDAGGKRGMSFDGNDDSVSVPGIHLESFTFAAVVKTSIAGNNVDSRGGLCSRLNNRRLFLLNGDKGLYSIEGNSRGGMSFRADVHGMSGEVNEYDWQFDIDGWTAVAVTYDGLTVRLYRDGKLTETGKVRGDDIAGIAYIGGTNIHHGDYWHGRMDEVAVFKRALTAQEVKELHRIVSSSREAADATKSIGAAPAKMWKDVILRYCFDKDSGEKVLDVSGKNRHASVHGARHSKDGRLSGAMHFDGEDDFLKVPKVHLENFTFSAWVMTPAMGSLRNTNNRRLFLLHGGPRYYALQGNSRGGIGFDVTGHKEVNEYDWRFEADTWTHIAITYSRPAVKLYKNGKLTEAGEIDVEGVTGTLYIGGTDQQYGRFWHGRMDEVAIFGRALTGEKVARLYAMTGLPAKAAPDRRR